MTDVIVAKEVFGNRKGSSKEMLTLIGIKSKGLRSLIAELLQSSLQRAFTTFFH